MTRNKKLSFGQYLKKEELYKAYPLGANNLISFHWANWKETADLVRNKLGAKRVEQLDKSIEFLKSRKVWVKNHIQQKEISLYELYDSYCDPRIKNALSKPQENEILLSMDNETGPFYPLVSKRWFDYELCARFVYKRIIESRMTTRNFRLNTQIGFNLRYQKNPLEEISLTLSQVNYNGFLLYIPYWQKILSWEGEDESVQFIKKDFNINEELEVKLKPCFQSETWVRTISNFSLNLGYLKSLVEASGRMQDGGIYLFVSYQDLQFMSLSETPVDDIKVLLNSTQQALKKAS